VAADVLTGLPASTVAARFHRAVVAALVDVAEDARRDTGLSIVALGGGVFVNTIVVRLLRSALERRDFVVLLPRLVPPTDAGIALGQAMIGAARLAEHGLGPARNPASSRSPAPSGTPAPSGRE